MNGKSAVSFWSAVLVIVLLFAATIAATYAWQAGVVAPAAEVAAAGATKPASATPAPSAVAPAIATTGRTLPATYTRAAAAPRATASATATDHPSATVTAAATATASPSATATNTPPAGATASSFATLEPQYTPGTAVPTPVPAFERPEGVTNILLLGNDVAARQGGRTDTIIVVSINEAAKTATMLSLPRDLYVVIPGWKMARINQALPHGHGSGYPGGGGALVKDTILYNFGIPVDHYVRIGFDGFKQAVDALDGIDVAVSCELRDWRLKEPELDPQVEENWEMFELGPGVYHMDGDLALWYVRSRRTTSDFERGRRQQQVLRAMLARGLSLDLLPQVPALWETYRETVETDIALPVLLRLAQLAPAVRDNGMQRLYLADAVRAWTSPGGGAVQLLRWEAAEPIFAQLMRPPLLNRAFRGPITVEVVAGDDVTYLLAADNLAANGFLPVRVPAEGETPAHTQATYHGSTYKGSFHWLLAWTLGLNSTEVTLSETEGTPYYRVTLGRDYDSCRPLLSPLDAASLP